MRYQVPQTLVDILTSGPSSAKTTQVANLQNYIQGLLGSSHHTFLQGSYKNDTATSDINDVDIVAIRRNTYSGKYSPPAVRPAVYWGTIFSEIEEKLKAQSRYQWTVKRDNKCIKVRGAFNADIVPAVQPVADPLSDPIVIFSFKQDQEILSYPRTHYANGVAKNQRTSAQYKPMVRMLKNWVQNHFGSDKTVVSSHKIEALVHSNADIDFIDDAVPGFVIAARNITERLGGAGRGLAQITAPPIMSVCGQEDICANWDYFSRSKFIEQLDTSMRQAYMAYDAPSQQEAEKYWRLAFNL